MKGFSLVLAVATLNIVNSMNVVAARLFVEQEASPPRTVAGEVQVVEGESRYMRDAEGKHSLDIEDRSYVIKNDTGEEVRLELSEGTKMLGRVNPGDRIEAKVSPEGRTISVQPVK